MSERNEPTPLRASSQASPVKPASTMATIATKVREAGLPNGVAGVVARAASLRDSARALHRRHREEWDPS